MNQTQLIEDLARLRVLLHSLNHDDLLESIAQSKDKKELQSNLSFAVKSLQSELAKSEPLPVQISKALMSGKPGGLHPDFSVESQHNAKPFNWQQFGKSMVHRIFKGKQ
ncbi:MAG TPA: hypothetical protein PKH77_01910 [Anaerolineae bacterium]|nr:hypothetical protein [Anaerolineae bacterium]